MCYDVCHTWLYHQYVDRTLQSARISPVLTGWHKSHAVSYQNIKFTLPEFLQVHTKSPLHLPRPCCLKQCIQCIDPIHICQQRKNSHHLEKEKNSSTCRKGINSGKIFQKVLQPNTQCYKLFMAGRNSIGIQKQYNFLAKERSRKKGFQPIDRSMQPKDNQHLNLERCFPDVDCFLQL